MEFTLLPDDIFLHILEYLNDSADHIAFALICKRLQQLCHHRAVVLFKKVDLTLGYKETLQNAVKNFFQDKLMTQHVTELNLNYCFNVWIDANLEESAIASCPQLRVLHVVDCGMSIRSLHRILQNAHKLRDLSWSMIELSPEDIEFMVQDAESNDGIKLENIRNLWIKTVKSKLHFEILRYFLLCRCCWIEKIEITLSEEADLSYSEWNNTFFPCNLASFKIYTLHHLHSLVVVSRYLEEYSGILLIMNDPIWKLLGDILYSLQFKRSYGKKWQQLVLPSSLEFYYYFYHALLSNSPDLNWIRVLRRRDQF